MAEAYKQIEGEIMPDGSFKLKYLGTSQVIDYPLDVEITHMTVWGADFQKHYKLENNTWVETDNL